MKRQIFYILFFIPLFTTCLESPVMTTGIVNGKEKPTVATLSASPIFDDGVLLFQGEIIESGKNEIAEKGFYWSTVSNDPGLTDNVIVLSGLSTGVFTYELKDVSGEKTYYWRAYARNSFGFDYGNVRSYQTPPIWIEKNAMNGDGRGRGAVFIANDKIYITCGEKVWGRVLTKETWVYSIAEDRWNQQERDNFPGDFRIYPTVFTLGDYAFVGTGLRASGIALKDFYRYNCAKSDQLSNPWTEIPSPNDFEARYEATAFCLNGKAYVIGGISFNRGNLNDVWQYDSENDSWQKMNDFPAYFYGGISISGNERAFVGFSDASESERILWEYNESNDSWSEFAILPEEATKKIYSSVIIRNNIYIVDEDNRIWALNISEKIWKEKTHLPPNFLDEVGRGGYQTLLTTGNSNNIYVGLGFSKLLYEYRPLWDN